MTGVRDTRAAERCTYQTRYLLWMGLLLFVLKLGSRRQLNFGLDSPVALANVNRLSDCDQERLAHHDTLNHFLGHIHPAELNRLRRQMVHRTVRMKIFDDARLFGHFVIVFDGTGELVFDEPHCDHCLQRTSHGKTQYYHYILEAKLVTPDGLAISVGTEFIENTDPKACKQDCERKAFYRLAPRLKRDFPQLRLCLCLDALYAVSPVLSICEENSWKYIIVFKEGSLPAVWDEYQALLKQVPDNRRTCQPYPRCRQSFAWVQDLELQGEDKKIHRFNAFECQENDQGEKHFFAWITNFRVTDQTVAALGNRGGRPRWKIENQGFNIQKNGGFNLEHAYSLGDQQIKNYYLLLQIAHFILQLLEKGSLLGQECKKLFGSLRNLALRLCESLRHYLVPDDALDVVAAARIQIRLDSS